MDQDAVRIGQPVAGIEEVFVQKMHHQVDAPSRSTAHEAAIPIGSEAEGQAGVVVVVERAKALVPVHLESKSLCDPLDGKVAELL